MALILLIFPSFFNVSKFLAENPKAKTDGALSAFCILTYLWICGFICTAFSTTVEAFPVEFLVCIGLVVTILGPFEFVDGCGAVVELDDFLNCK